MMSDYLQFLRLRSIEPIDAEKNYLNAINQLVILFNWANTDFVQPSYTKDKDKKATFLQ